MPSVRVARPQQNVKQLARAQFTNLRCWAKFWSTYTGKDKTARVIQYASRGLKWYLQSRNPNSILAANLNILSKNISTSRVTFRLFRWVDEWFKFVDSSRSGYRGSLKLCDTSANLLKCVFIFMNNIYFLLTWRLAGPGTAWLQWTDKKKWKLLSARVRILEVLTGLVTQLLLIRRWTQLYREASGPQANSPRDVNRRAAAIFKRRGAMFKAVVYLMNAVTYGENSGLWAAITGGTHVHDGWMGLAGTVSGFCGMRDTWTKSIVQ